MSIGRDKLFSRGTYAVSHQRAALSSGPLFFFHPERAGAALTVHWCYNAFSLLEASVIPAPTCAHVRTLLIAKDEHEEYLECLDCGEIFEVAEREPSSPGFNETLSDA